MMSCMASLLTTSNKGTFRLLSNHYPITQQRYDFCCNKRLVGLGHAVWSIDNKYHSDIKELILSMFEKIPGIKIFLYSPTT